MSDTREPRPAPILASDAERERRVAPLRDAVGEGRLALEEFSERVGLAQTALEIYNLFGTVTAIVPDGVEVVVRGGGPSRAGSRRGPTRFRACPCVPLLLALVVTSVPGSGNLTSISSPPPARARAATVVL
jgi:hypothetical protein